MIEDRFHISLAQLQEMYAHSAWRGSAYGGNAWRNITRLLLELADADESDVGPILGELSAARHNTGTLVEKLTKLDAALAKTGT